MVIEFSEYREAHNKLKNEEKVKKAAETTT